MAYKVTLIDVSDADRLFKKYKNKNFHSSKADISGICVKLYSEDREFTAMWEDNFYAMSDSIKSHARIICVKENGAETEALYDRITRTAFLVNFDYYGWVKSIALAVASDILEDSHGVYSVHGAAVEVDGTGVTLIAPSKTGKTTQSWGLLRAKNARLITDDWYFFRLGGGRPIVTSSERNCYIDADIGDVWEEYRSLVQGTRFDNKGRGIANIRWVTGYGSVISMTTMKHVILLKRDPSDPTDVRKMTSDEALSYLKANDLCNPHQMIRDERKMRIREDAYASFLDNCIIHMVNTTSPARVTQDRIREVLGIE